ncbi:type IX secretion system membrane protein PorP/SprF, partial [Serratia nevei]|uniref:type IX secretion system membrane protein PorP/SprF n=1 Tax=Serratia nevei TaxID=2703794 RepID=UPI00209D20DC
RTAISTLNSNVSIGSSLKTASFTPGGSELHWHVGHFYIGTNSYNLLRKEITDIADEAGVLPRRISFVAALNLLVSQVRVSDRGA